MEESEERRERLKAMRAQSRFQGHFSEVSGYPSPGLSNPFIEKENTFTTGAQYTSPYSRDPTFSANKRKKNCDSPQAQPMLPGQRMFHAPRPHFNLQNRPMETAAHSQGMTPPRAWGGSSADPPSLSRFGPSNVQGGSLQSPVSFPGQRMFRAPSYIHGPFQNPMGTANAQGQGTPPGAPSSGAFNYNNPPYLSKVGSNFTGPSNVQGGSPYADYGRGRGHRHGTSSTNHSKYARGRGRSLGSGASGGRGVGCHSRNPVSAEVRPDLYYKKEMTEDPWKSMTPVRWKKLPPSPEPVSVSKPSLAESLASSLYDQSSEAVDSDQGS